MALGDTAMFKRTAVFFGLLVVLIYVLVSGPSRQLYLLENYLSPFYSNLGDQDFSHYIHSKTFLLPDEHRLIIVGDIHGQYNYLQDLLDKLRYDSSSNDIFVHVGDLLAKGGVPGSLQVLDWMMTRNITGIRGNHDQKVIGCKAWRDWIRESDEGRNWLDNLETKWEEEHDDAVSIAGKKKDTKKWVEKQKEKSWKRDKKWWKKVPDGWKMFQEHYLIASALNQEQYDYLLSLPLILHVPAYHAFIAHAGLLASDPTRNPFADDQPLAHIPASPANSGIGLLRRLQEIALLREVPQNRDQWVVLNMRSLMKDHSVTSGKKGTPWSPGWNSMMDQCSGFSGRELHTSDDDYHCLPSTIIYGHAAGRGLDVKRWSFGLDSGCVYEHRLTALVLESPLNSRTSHDEDLVEYYDDTDYDDAIDEAHLYSRSSKRRVQFGDINRPANAYLVDVKCR